MAGELASAPELNNEFQQASGSGTSTAVPPISSREVAPTSNRSQSSGGLVDNLKLAGNDFVQWWYQPHGSLFDGQMANLEASGVKREYVGYGLIALAALLQLTRFGPFVANAICIAYPLIASRSQQDAPKWLVYWSLFGLLSLLDATSFALSAAYWIAKISICTWLYLPQTQGALIINGLAIEPAASFVAAKIST